MNRHERRRQKATFKHSAKPSGRRTTLDGNDVPVYDATEPINVTMLGVDYVGPEVLGVNGVVEAVRQYPNGTTASMGLCYFTDSSGNRVDGPKRMVIDGPTDDVDDPRNVMPDGTLAMTVDNATRLHNEPTQQH